jgi:hypothetical protein
MKRKTWNGRVHEMVYTMDFKEQGKKPICKNSLWVEMVSVEQGMKMYTAFKWMMKCSNVMIISAGFMHHTDS